MTREKPKECPKCKSKKVKKIVYGLIRLTPWGMMSMFFHNFVGGGCVVKEDSPAWYCGKCKKSWGNYQDLTNWKEV